MIGSHRSVAAWITATIAASFLIFTTVAFLHEYAGAEIKSATESLGTLRQARTDLYQAFLHLGLGEKDVSPVQRERGLALLDHAREEFRRGLDPLAAADESERKLLEQVDSLWTLAAISYGFPSGTKEDLQFRAALDELDAMAVRVDDAKRAAFETIQRRLDAAFSIALVLSTVLLAVISGGMIWVGRRQMAAIDALRGSKERFRRLFDEAPFPMGLVDASGKIVALNNRFKRDLGYTLEDLPTLDAWWTLAYRDPDYRHSVMERWHKGLSANEIGLPFTASEFRVARKDGEERVMLVSGIKLEDGVLTAFTDVTDRVESQAALTRHLTAVEAANRESGETLAKLEAALAAMSDAVSISNTAGEIVHFNDAFARFNQYATRAECPNTVAELFASFDLYALDGTLVPREMRPRARALRGDTGVDQQYRVRQKETGKTWIGSYNYAPIRDTGGRIVGTVVASRDITERRREEDELYANREKLQLLIEHAPAALAMFDREMRYLAVSRRWAEDYKLQGRDVVGRFHYELFPEIPEAWREVHRRGMAGEVVTKDEDQWIWPDGTIHWLRWEVRPWYGRDGEVGGIGIFTADITKRKKAEADLLQSQALLAQAQKVEAIGQLTGGVAHDFNNLLGVIMGNLDLIRMDAEGVPGVGDMVDAALRATKRGAELTGRLLAFARRQDLKPQRVNLNGIACDMAKLLERTIGMNITIETKLSETVDGVVVDPGQLENALLNLAVNARDAMPEGGRLAIATEHATIDAACAARHPDVEPGTYEMISISDTGHGMTPEVLDRVFEPFFTTKEVGKGSGLGLSMVHGFVKQSRGHVTILSQPGQGTTVKIYLPAAPLGVQQGRPEGQAADMEQGSGEKILVVEDDLDLRQFLAVVLKKLGYDAHLTENGPAALAYLGSGAAVDMMLTDVIMPGGMNGVDLAAAARRMRPGLRVLYMSGFAGSGAARQSIQGEKGQLLAKPFTTSQLAKAIAGMLEREGARNSAN